MLRDVDHRLQLTALLVEQLHDPRDAEKNRYEAVEVFWERLCCQTLGYASQDAAYRFSHDPEVRVTVWDRPGDAMLEERLASQRSQSRFVAWLAASGRNCQVVRQALGESLRRYVLASEATERRVRRATIDIDSFPIVVHGKQAGAAYNSHYGDTATMPARVAGMVAAYG